MPTATERRNAARAQGRALADQLTAALAVDPENFDTEIMHDGARLVLSPAVVEMILDRLAITAGWEWSITGVGVYHGPVSHAEARAQLAAHNGRALLLYRENNTEPWRIIDHDSPSDGDAARAGLPT